MTAPDASFQAPSAQESPAQSERAPRSDSTTPTAEAGGEGEPSRDVREEVVEVGRSKAPAAPPDRQPSPPRQAAINTPLLAQGGRAAESAQPAGSQSWGDGVPAEPSAGSRAAPQETRAPVEAVTAPRAATSIIERQAPAGERLHKAQVLVEQNDPTLKVSSEQMSAEQRNYIARVIRWLDPPLRYEWIPKYTRPAFFTSLVTAGEPPECRIDFNGPTVITFDLVIRGGSGTESRLEDVEITYR
jgi:hypothetical protein